MMHTFNLTATNQPAVVERLLRVIRHRGFALQSFELKAVDHDLQIDFTVQSTRAVNLLFNQLEKLYDVKQIKLT
ncbi:MAG: acetolactate synthase 2 small subunit [Gammaproteobacteria bacterium]|nr:MAG: acetolactate synthase 2 small subunit [Gammaproteobacteria bacterium]